MTAIDFLATEATLLDDRRYKEWGELFTTDCRYWAPYEWDAASPRRSVNIIYDDLNRLQDRIARLLGGDMHSQDPPSRTCRLLGQPARVTDPVWSPDAEFDEIWTVPFRLSELRHEHVTEYAGRYTYWLARSSDEYRIAGKKVQMLQAGTPLSNLTFPL